MEKQKGIDQAILGPGDVITRCSQQDLLPPGHGSPPLRAAHVILTNPSAGGFGILRILQQANEILKQD